MENFEYFDNEIISKSSEKGANIIKADKIRKTYSFTIIDTDEIKYVQFVPSWA